MAVLLMAGIAERIITVLQDYLPAELDLIDTAMADGITTPDIANADYHSWDRPLLEEYPAVSIRVVSSTPTEIRPLYFGERMDCEHRADVMFHAIHADANQDPAVLQKHLLRYIAGAVRVLCVEKEALQSSADPTRIVQMVTWAGPAEYGPSIEQEDGATVRTATLPLSVRLIEVRS